MKYNQGILETVVRTVPVGDVVADTAYVIGAEILVAVEDGTAGTYGVFVKRGCCGLEFLAGDEPAAGAACYLNNTTHKIEATASATNYLIGCRNSSLESDIPATRVMVDLDGTAATVCGVPGDIQGVTAGTGLTGGGTSGTVTLAVDTTLHPTMPAVGGAGNLVQTAAADRALSDSGIAVANVPTMAAVGVAGNLLQTAADDRAISDSGIAVANVPTMVNAAGGADRLIVSDGADKTLRDSWIPMADILQKSRFEFVEVTIASGAASGSSAADERLVDGAIFSYFPKSGNNQPVASVVLNGDGSVTVTASAAETADAKFEVAVCV